MNMEDFQCESFDIRIPFTLEAFDKDAFLKAAEIEDESEYLDEDGNLFLFLSFSSRAKPPKDHAHLRIVIRKNKAGLATLSYHQAGKNKVNRTPPYLEDCASWLGNFFKQDNIESSAFSTYRFGKEFSTAIPLPFPLVAEDKDLAGLKVSGLALLYPKNHLIEHVVLERSATTIYLFIQHNEGPVRLKKFDLFAELEKLQAPISSLVKKREKTNGRNKKTSKT